MSMLSEYYQQGGSSTILKFKIVVVFRIRYSAILYLCQILLSFACGVGYKLQWFWLVQIYFEQLIILLA